MIVLTEVAEDDVEEDISIRSRHCNAAWWFLVDICRPVWSNLYNFRSFSL